MQALELLEYKRFFCLIFLIIPFSFPINSASAQGITTATTSNPILKDQKGDVLTEAFVGELSVVSISILSNADNLSNFVAIIEARDGDGVTQFLQFQTGQVQPSGEAEIGISWTPKQAGNYELRTFLISGFEDPEVLSEVTSSSVQIKERGEYEGYYIRMERVPCDGFCPGYIFQLFGNGTIFFDGGGYVPAKGHHASEISQEQIGELIDEFESIGFFELEDVYGSSGCIGCGGTILSLTNSNGETKTVRHTPGNDVPEMLLALEDKIEYILVAEGWLNPTNE